MEQRLTPIGYGVMVNIGDSHLEYSPARGSIPRIRDTMRRQPHNLFHYFCKYYFQAEQPLAYTYQIKHKAVLRRMMSKLDMAWNIKSFQMCLLMKDNLIRSA